MLNNSVIKDEENKNNLSGNLNIYEYTVNNIEMIGPIQSGELKSDFDIHMSSSHVDSSNSGRLFQPASFEAVNPIIPEQEDDNVIQNAPLELKIISNSNSGKSFTQTMPPGFGASLLNYNTTNKDLHNNLNNVNNLNNYQSNPLAQTQIVGAGQNNFQLQQQNNFQSNYSSNYNLLRHSKVTNTQISPDAAKNHYPRQISLNHTLKNNKNFSIVIVENSPFKKLKQDTMSMSLKKHSLNYKIEDHQIESEDIGQRMNTINDCDPEYKARYYNSVRNTMNQNQNIKEEFFDDDSKIEFSNNHRRKNSDVIELKSANYNRNSSRRESKNPNFQFQQNTRQHIYLDNNELKSSNEFEKKTEQENLNVNSPNFNFIDYQSNNPVSLMQEEKNNFNLEQFNQANQINQVISNENFSNLNNQSRQEEMELEQEEINLEKNNFNFDNSQIRRYKRSDLQKAKNYFKFRYISEKLLEINNIVDLKNSNVSKMSNNNLQQQNLQNNFSPPFKPSNSTNNLKEKENQPSSNQSSPPLENLNPDNNIYYSADDKNVIKFTCLFLQKMEKAIFLFNMKKYEESYTYLKESSIIKNEEEFAEILLIFPGYDKFVIGEFLSKEKSPNTNFLLLNFFINKMDFTGQTLLNSFRYLLYRMNLPTDSSLIMSIIDVFSNVFYKDNCYGVEFSHFRNVTAVYILSNSILTLNSLLHANHQVEVNQEMIKYQRSYSGTKVFNFKTKEEFININDGVDAQYCEEIYEEIRISKLDIIYDYNEQIYRKLEFEDVMGRTLRGGYNANIMTSNANNPMSSERGTIVNGEELIDMLKLGQKFLKYGRSGEPHERYIYLSQDEQTLFWKPLTCSCFNSDRSIKTKSLINVYIGTSNSIIFNRYKIRPEYELNCFSILSEKRTLDLRHEDSKIVKKWSQAIKYLIKRVISKFEVKKKKLKELSNRKEIISDFWRTEILPNWTHYRDSLLIKGENVYQIFSNNEIYKRNLKNKFLNKKSSDTGKFQEKKKIEEKDKQDVAYLWFLGIPDWLRKKLWSLIITNDLDINENLFNHFLRKNEMIEFYGDTAVDRGNQQEVTPGEFDEQNLNPNLNSNNLRPNQKIVGEYDGIPIIEDSEPKITEMRDNNVTDPLLNEIIIDVHKCYRKFEDYIKMNNLENKKFKEDLFKILRIFTNYRPDITYSRQIGYITTIFYLNSEDYYQAFVLSSNFIVHSFLTNFLNKDEIFMKTRCDFFEQLVNSHCPLVYNHFRNLDISIRLFFYDWVEYLYTKTFKYETVLRLFDCLLVKGEIFIYEVAISIIKLQEKDLLNVS
jgi:hypothetical protein